MKSAICPFLLFLLLTNWVSPVFSQVKIAKVVYHCEALLINTKGHSGTNTLYFTPDKCKYIHNDYPKEDSYSGLGTNAPGYTKGDQEGLPVFIDRSSGLVYYKTDYPLYPNRIYILKEKIPSIDWIIMKETRKIGNLQAIHAKGVFGGRTYNVWFTPDIPIPFGPYKLGGLPGLILEAYSEDGIVKYKFERFESSTADAIEMEKPKQGIEVTWEELRQIDINWLLEVEAMSTDRGFGTNEDPPADHEIEKSKFTFVSEYKRQRNSNKTKKQ
jgi:GLPGLI family protein